MRCLPISLAAALALALTPAAAAGAAPAPAPAAAPTASTVTLPTGEQLQVRDAGGLLQVIQNAAHPVEVQRIGREVYAIPLAYVTLVGSAVDRSLFDLTRLHGVQVDAVPVSLTLPSPAMRVPGVRVGPHTGTAARGVITDPVAFGGYLRSLAHEPPSAALPRIALAAGRTPPVSSTATGRQVTVSVGAIAPTSGPPPRSIGVLIANTDDSTRYLNQIDVTGGPQQVRLPVGHYALFAESLQLSGRSPNQVGVFHDAYATDLDVTTDGQELSVDLRRATQSLYPTFAGTAHLHPEFVTAFQQLTDAKGVPVVVFQYVADPTVVSLIAPSNGATIGRLSSSSLGQFAAADGSSEYFYSAGHPNAVVPAEPVRIAPSAVSTVQARYYAGPGVDSTGFMGRTPVYPYLDPGVVLITDVAMPSARTEYLAGSAGVVWHSIAQQQYGRNGVAALQDIQAYPPGQTTREDFWRGPIAAGVRSAPASLPNVCTMCRTDQVLAVGLAPSTDTDPAHGGLLVGAPGGPPNETRLRVYQGDTLLSDTTNTTDDPRADVQVPVPSGSAGYRIVENVNRAVDRLPLSTRSTSVWSFVSAGGSGGAIPSTWTCGASGTGACTVPDVLSVRVPLPTSLSGALPTGDSSFVVTVGRAQNAVPSTVTGLSFAISSDGTTFTPQRVIPLSGNRFVVTIHNTATAGTPMTVRWSAADAAGSTVTQTVQAAYLAG